MFVAVSNPCFEFWLLLHLKDPTHYSKKELEEILENKKVTSKKRTVDKMIEKERRYYNKKNTMPNYFLPNIENALQRAKDLDKSQKEYPTQLGSHVYKLIERIKKK